MILKMINFLASPFVRAGGWILAAVAFIGIIYGRGRRDARKEIEGETNADALRRTQDSIAAGNRAAAGQLRQDDGHKRPD
jgi:hypothetical protein